MTQQPPMRGFIIHGQLHFFCPFDDDIQNRFKNFRLQPAIAFFYQTVAARRVKADQQPVFACGDRKLCLVAVMIRLLAADDRLRLQGDAADTAHGVGYTLPFIAQLCLVSDMPPCAAAAAAESTAVSCASV